MRAGAGFIAAICVCLAGLPPGASAQELARTGPCWCPGDEAGPNRPGTIWRGERFPSLDEIAGLAAPILWFSPDEPLIERRRGPLPNPIPGDRPSEIGVVYYRLEALVLAGREHVSPPEEDDQQFFEKVSRFTLRYYFYYRSDLGFRGHDHDIEGMEFQMALDREANGCSSVRVIRVRGFAHGVDWYSNELEVAEDTRFPLTVLVEEGKHASAPDRNADGLYTPGYDVNRRVNDAWGVRDVMASGFFSGAAYSSYMTKARRPDTRAFPVESPLACGVPPEAPQSPSRGMLNRYELRRASAAVAAVDDPSLASVMASTGFRRKDRVRQYESAFIRELDDEVSGTKGIVRNISFRYDGGFGASLILPGFDLRQGYIVPKINLTSPGAVTFQALMTTSAARLVSPYLAVGGGRQQVTKLDPAAPDLTTEAYKWHMATEVGAKVRFRLTGKARLLVLGYHFGGIRFGLSAFGFTNLNLRLAVEVGAGVW